MRILSTETLIPVVRDLCIEACQQLSTNVTDALRDARKREESPLCQEILDLLAKYEVRRCYYGHLHSGSHKLAVEGLWDGVEYKLVSSDYLGFKPHTVIF